MAAAVLAWSALGAVAPAVAQAPPPATGIGPVVPMVAVANAELLKPGLYRVNGAGAGTLLRFDANGLVVVVANQAGVDPRFLDAEKSIADGTAPPVRALILIEPGTGRAGDVAQAIDAGVPVIVQQRALARRGDRARAAAEPGRFITYENDYLLHAGGFDVEAEYVGSGRTGADSVVLFRDLRVVAVGELFTRGTPEPDCASGGSFAGWAAAIDHLLWFDFDIVVPSHGPPVGRPDVEAFRKTLMTLAQGHGSASSPDPPDCSAARQR